MVSSIRPKLITSPRSDAILTHVAYSPNNFGSSMWANIKTLTNPRREAATSAPNAKINLLVEICSQREICNF